jgi:hypothetical protein
VAEGGKLFLFDLVVDGKGLQGRLVDGAQRLGLVRERARIKFSQIDQFGTSSRFVVVGAP